MKTILRILNKFTVRVTVLLFSLVAVAILVMASLSYSKLYEVTETNAAIRIDRAARAAATIFGKSLGSEFSILRDEDGRPTSIQISGASPETALTFRPEHDAILKEIGATNQGAANLFKFNQATKNFDRFATTFRQPDGSMPPPMSISAGHPAYADLFSNSVHVGEVPVLGRLRLAFLIPIQSAQGAVSGALAVDVGWVDDLIVARNELQKLAMGWAIAILALVAGLGVWRLRFELRPLVQLAQFANDLAKGETTEKPPFLNRDDEVGALAHGLERVVEIQRDLAYLAYTDELTGLGNRSRYLADLREVTSKCQNGIDEWMLLHLDLDRFADANIEFGQAGGDALLKQVGAAIVEIVGPNAYVSRFAGDRFSVIMPCKCEKQDNAELCKNVLARLSAPFLFNDFEIHLSASIGTTMLPKDATSPEDAHLNADMALRNAKTAGGNGSTAFEPDLYADVHHQIELERMLRDAVRQGEVGVYFQPQIAPKTLALTGLEALARWPHPEKGMIPPNEFIPIAESTGLIVELGASILDQTCAQARIWLDEGFEFKHISVNVSPMQLWQPGFVGVVRDILKRHNLAAHYICLEVTENLFVDQKEGRVRAILCALKSLGVSISLDDFGSGYSSLGYLSRLPFDQIKIDRSFVMDVDLDSHKQKLLAGIVSLGHGLGLNVVAEGAETENEIKYLAMLGCDCVQGYFYAHPMACDEIPAAVAQITAGTTPLITQSA